MVFGRGFIYFKKFIHMPVDTLHEAAENVAQMLTARGIIFGQLICNVIC